MISQEKKKEEEGVDEILRGIDSKICIQSLD